MKTKHRESIISIVSLIVGALLSWVVAFVMPAKPVDLSKNSKSDLTCTLEYVRGLVTKRTADNRFKIVFEDKEVENPYILDISIKNTGSHAIKEEDFRDDFVIAIEGGAMILSEAFRSHQIDIWKPKSLKLPKSMDQSSIYLVSF